MRRLPFACPHSIAWGQGCADCQTDAARLRAQVADLKARLREVRALATGRDDVWRIGRIAFITDLRVKDWRKP